MDRKDVQVNQTTVDSELTEQQRTRAARRVASAASDARDCAMLLDALGLRAEEGKQVQTAQRKAS